MLLLENAGKELSYTLRFCLHYVLNAFERNESLKLAIDPENSLEGIMAYHITSL